MKVFRCGLAIGAVAGVLLAMAGCSWDFNNPKADEWDVQIVGDSVFDLSGDIQKVLKTLSGKTYKDRSVSGAKIAAIQSQLNQALQRATLKTVIADGGANDILQGTMDCDSDPLTQGCIDVLNYVADKMEVMLEAMYNGPPDDCVWLGYYHVKGSQAEKNEAIDYAYDWLYPDVFASTNMSAVLVDPRDEILPEHLKSDNIHPTYAGSQILANLIWDAMVAGNMYR
ncbi:MAG TPA: SGNH/GDSL hydrolase family protein [Deltaproteobacteria bacterium]|nr:SGNH/GDSL hydrolase family protein [Deltaproteobacteria bacterium]HOM27865.1 SGNH/GDSL hydrolase family protein [Deltaproteobacteria bacterium]HPP79599.1 SGNH/GDSL hydrolase family protein [Deltaproteobacteria bacterium]